MPRNFLETFRKTLTYQAALAEPVNSRKSALWSQKDYVDGPVPGKPSAVGRWTIAGLPVLLSLVTNPAW